MQRADSLEKNPRLGKMEGKRRRQRQRMRWFHGTINSTDVNLSKLWETVKVREAWCAIVHGAAKKRTWISDQTTPGSSLFGLGFFSYLQSFPTSGSFQMSQLFASGGQSIGVSASTSVLPVNSQDWSPLGWARWISLQSKGLSRVFSSTTVQKHQFFSTQLSL